MYEKSKIHSLATILFISGFCSLAYQVIWLREFRLIFGGATPAASAVLAIFMGGIGLGGWYFGRKADNSRKPGQLYSFIELAIATFAITSPLILKLVNSLYLSTGGIQSLGQGGAITLQLLLTTVVIGPACFCMGGTIPTAIKYAQSDDDKARRTTAYYYGINILGAVTGAFCVNFIILPLFGNWFSLIASASVNLAMACTAYLILGKNEETRTTKVSTKQPNTEIQRSTDANRTKPIYFIAFLSGFVFFVIEIIWFRTSVPLLGGSVYNFGLILVIALAGMSLGGLGYSLLLGMFKPSYKLLSLITIAFALAIMLPFAFGDSFAHFCLVLQNAYINHPFFDKLWMWFLISGLLVFPASFMAGMQFPAMLSLLGQGNNNVGAQTGRLYAANTFGAIIGSLAGGLILIPIINISNTWQVLGTLTIIMALIAFFKTFTAKERPNISYIAIFSTSALICLLTLFSGQGLTPYWQHNPIGFGRSTIPPKQTLNSALQSARHYNAVILEKFDGRETTIAIAKSNDLSLLSNGKSDGSALADAGTQIMLGMLGSALHQHEVANACVIGLGTGTSAGWLAEISSVEHVDVLELEPKLIAASSHFDAVNHKVNKHPKVSIHTADAREFLVVKGGQYDLIASEPSNPHRAGVANLYTHEFYQSVAKRLNDDGVFTQWIQAYEISADMISLIINTLKATFPKVEIYNTLGGDLVFVCQNHNNPWNTDSIRAKMSSYPHKEAIRYSYGQHSLEGLLTLCIGNGEFTDFLSKSERLLNTDSLNHLEFQLGKTAGQSMAYNVIDQIASLSYKKQMVMPSLDKECNYELWQHLLASTLLSNRRDTTSIFDDSPWLHEITKRRIEQIQSPYIEALQNLTAINYFETLAKVNRLALDGDESFIIEIEKIKDHWPIDYHTNWISFLRNQPDKTTEVAKHYHHLFNTMQHQVWCQRKNVLTAMNLLAADIADHKWSTEKLAELVPLIEKPFPIYTGETARLEILWQASLHLDLDTQLQAIEAYGPYFPWIEDKLSKRVEVYSKLKHPKLSVSQQELAQYKTNELK